MFSNRLVIWTTNKETIRVTWKLNVIIHHIDLRELQNNLAKHQRISKNMNSTEQCMEPSLDILHCGTQNKH